MIVACTRLLRGAGYVTFNGELPEQAQHSALASEYAHVTAPLRRLTDRYAGEICLALCAGTEVPDWVVTAMHELPDTMASSARRAHAYENAIVDLCEAELLHDRVGETFSAVVVDLDEKDRHEGDITIQDPAIEATVTGTAELPLGEEVTVELVRADPRSRAVEFRLA
jgi:exoribonuclease R